MSFGEDGFLYALAAEQIVKVDINTKEVAASYIFRRLALCTAYERKVGLYSFTYNDFSGIDWLYYKCMESCFPDYYSVLCLIGNCL